MIIKTDFILSKQFGAVERIIFNMVLLGYGKTNEYSTALPIFSDEVIANAVKHLVNQQLLALNVESCILSLSEPVKTLIKVCHDSEHNIDIPDVLIEQMEKDCIVIDNSTSERIKSKELIMRELLPDVNLDFLVGSIDFCLYKKAKGDNV